MDQPVPFILTGDDGHGLVVDPRAKEALAKIEKPVVVVSVVGMYRTGKSFLLNRLMNRTDGFLVNENSDLDLTPTFNLTAPLWELLALDLSTAMVVITGATLLRSYNLEKFETVMVAGCKKVLGRRGTMSSCKTTEKTRGEMTQDKVRRQTEQTDSMMAHLCHLSSASLATIFLSGTDRLNAQSGIDINYERTRVNDQLKGSLIEVRNCHNICYYSINVSKISSP